MKLDRFAVYAWGVLGYNIFVILWGALVRATGSGAGCGSHWPTCQGEIIPWSPQIETLIEFTHRITSGVALLLVIGLLIWAFRRYPAGHRVRLGASLTFGFIIIESLLGAGLVLFELTGNDTSNARAMMIAIHLINTFILLGVITLTAWWASGGRPIQLKGQGWLGMALGLGFIGMLILGASGAITALGDTLFPAESFTEGWQQKFDPTAHILVRLRLYHPLIAIGVGAYLVAIMRFYTTKHSQNLTLSRLSNSFTAIYVFQLILGAFNVVLLAPIWMQLVHLLISDLLLINVVMFISEAFAVDEPQPYRELEAVQPVAEASGVSQ